MPCERHSGWSGSAIGGFFSIGFTNAIVPLYLIILDVPLHWLVFVESRDIWFRIVQRVGSLYLGSLKRRIKMIDRNPGLKGGYLL